MKHVLRSSCARKRQGGIVGYGSHRRSSVLERLAFEQTGQQKVTLVPEPEFLVEVAVVHCR